jgi:uncharacterized membrane protein
MKKEEFLGKLKKSLAGIPDSEVDDIISDYQEHFRAGEESSRSESELCHSLGDPTALGRQLRANYHIEKAENKKSVESIVRAVLATAGLGFFNLLFIALPFFGAIFILFWMFAGGIFAFFSGVVGFVASAVSLIFPGLLSHANLFNLMPVAGIFISAAIIGFSMLFLIGCWYLAKWFYKLTVSYLKVNINIIKG